MVAKRTYELFNLMTSMGKKFYFQSLVALVYAALATAVGPWKEDFGPRSEGPW
jgi:hypothetical protein